MFAPLEASEALEFTGNGFERLFPSVVPHVLLVVPPSSDHPSSLLGGILAVCLTRMGVNLVSLAPLSHKLPQFKVK
ncbi:hypothetical protein DSO57_1012311 [Entomophthora muscae]|uniref:Uncharacterized protein n=1 Tax=Entomophthora muscae TaxID=34485 RepID=A0ACC2T696_9FUNG|nr:hypothetical protein DSO57_1012311 [Entomophthora muscae]